MIKDLTHANNQKVKAALAEARDHGDVTWVKPLLEAYAGRQEDALREEMRDLLSTMKISSAEQVFADALVDSAYGHIKSDVLSFLWNCGFTCDGRLARVAEVASEGDFQQALEGATLIEQVESVVDEKDLLEAQVLVGEALQDNDRSGIHPFLEAMRSHLAALHDGMQ
ncbi:MAG: hypothetical protein VYA72_07895 [Bacteroidota bacterium]|nr:hypothetical protein [Bacteroidota bacterium]